MNFHPKPPLLLPSLILTALLACGGGKGGGGDSPAPDPADDSGGTDSAEPWAGGVLFGLANLDDDDVDGQADWDQIEVVADEDDLAAFLVPEGLDGQSLTLEGALVRVWRDGALLADGGGSFTVAAGETLQIELGAPAAAGFLRSESAELRILAAPMLVNHHLLEAEASWAGADSSSGTAVPEAFGDVLGDAATDVPIGGYEYDIWVQDEVELVTTNLDDDRRIDIVIDSIRSNHGRGLDDFAEEMLAKDELGIRTWGEGRATSQDSFGNMESTPPLTVGGVEYPFGRIYYGKWQTAAGADEVTEDLREALAAQTVQAPVELNVGFLCVGHVDEFITFLPDPEAPRGFWLAVADTSLGLAFLDSQDPALTPTRYKHTHHYTTVGEMQEDAALRAYNEDLQRDGIEPALATLLAATGLDEGDVLRLPALFEEVGWCYGTGVSLIPGTINMAVLPLPDGSVHVIMADPFWREDSADIATDPFVAEIERLLPDSLTTHWADNWYTLHAMMGEVHCGSNIRRQPVAGTGALALSLLESR